MHIVMTRSFNHIGPYQKDVFVVSSFVRQFIEAERSGAGSVVINAGDVSVTRDFTDVRDVVRAYETLLDVGGDGEIYNVCSMKYYQLKDIISMIGKVTGIEAAINFDEMLVRPLENTMIVGNNEKIRAKCGWKPMISIETSLSDIVDYWRSVI